MTDIPVPAQFALIGLGATAIMDIWAWFLRLTLNAPSLDYALVGRWIGHVPRGTLRHAAIGASQPIRAERAIGWTAHYVIGAGLAVLFSALVPNGWLNQPQLLPAAGFGCASVLLPFLIMQPAFGVGIAASNSTHPWKARAGSLNAHLSFGVGLYLSALVLAQI